MRVVPSIDARLVEAIEQRRQLEIRYLADPAAGGVRLIEPHVIYTARSGALTVDAVQVAGDSSSGLESGSAWRGFDLAEVEVVRIGERRFAVDDRLSLDNHARYARILLAVEGG